MSLFQADERLTVARVFGDFFRREAPLQVVRAAAEKGSYDRALWEAFRALGGDSASLAAGGGDLGDAVVIGMELGRNLAPIPYAETVAASRLAERLGLETTGGDVLVVLEVSHPGQVGFAATAALVVDIDQQRCGIAGVEMPDESLGNLGGLPLDNVDLDVRTVDFTTRISASEIGVWRSERRMLYAATLVGAGREALDLVGEHVKQRHQFGRPIGSFQAVAHRLADCATELKSAELLLARATENALRSSADPYWSAVALSAAARAAELAAREALQFFGGYGYSIEYDVHLYLRYAKAVRVLSRDRYVGEDSAPTRSWPERLASAADSRTSPRRSCSELVQTVADFVHDHTSEDRIENAWASGTIHDDRVHRAMADKGWIGGSWPADLGGSLSPQEAGTMWELLSYHRVPFDLLEITEMAAWVILKVGPDAMRERVLPAVRAGELLLAIGYSEPDAGSDVAATKTVAEREASLWRINGAKIFTTGAHVANEVLLLARTERSTVKHEGLTMFLVPLSSPGVEVAPIRTFGGERTNSLFLDDVIVDDSCRVTEVGLGWHALLTGLEFERSMMGMYVGRAQRVMDDLVEAMVELSELNQSPDRLQLAEMNVRIEQARVMADHVYGRVAAGTGFSVEAAMTKILATEIFKDLSYVALDLLGPRSLLKAGIPGALVQGRLEHWFRHSQIATIYGGANEIQRNIIARHHLGLPQS